MDNKLIQQYAEDILCYRLRTARQKKRMQYEDFDKQLIQLYKEERNLWKQQRNLGWEPLQPPVQKGWKRFFILRADVASSKDAAFFQEILNKINTTDWSYRKDFKKKKRKFGKKIYVVRPHELQKLDTWKYLKLDFGEKEKAYFNEEFYVDKKTGRLVRKFVFVEPWRFVLCVRPNIIDKVRIRDVELESRIKQVDNYMERNDFRKRQQRIMHGNYQNWRYFDFEKFSEKNALKNQPLQRILDDLKDEC